LKIQATEINLSDGPWRKIALKEIVHENAVTDAKTPWQDCGGNMEASIDGTKEGSSGYEPTLLEVWKSTPCIFQDGERNPSVELGPVETDFEEVT
jgi:hypothetical protein